MRIENEKRQKGQNVPQAAFECDRFSITGESLA